MSTNEFLVSELGVQLLGKFDVLSVRFEVVWRHTYINDFWASIQQEFARTGMKTRLSGSVMREWLTDLVRVARWRWWFADKLRFALYGSYIAQARRAQNVA